jgi:hypothetical protein
MYHATLHPGGIRTCDIFFNPEEDKTKASILVHFTLRKQSDIFEKEFVNVFCRGDN